MKQNGFLIPPHPLTNFKIQKYYQNELRFDGFYFRDNLTKINDRAYEINLDEYSDIGTDWVALYVNSGDFTYFDSFGVEHIPKEIKTFINRRLSSASQNKNIKTNIFRMQTCDLIMCGYFCIRFIDFMLAGKTLTGYTILYSSNNFKKMDDITLIFFYEQYLK